MANRRPIVLLASGNQAFLEEAPIGDALDQRGDLLMNSNFITGLADPTTPQGAATKAYVDALVNGLDWKNSCRVATSTDLAVTAAGSGVGKTLTANANGAATLDGVVMALNDRVLVRGQVTGSDNGVYVVTDIGSGGTPYVLTRSLDADANLEVTANLTVFISAGTDADTGWTLTTNDPIVVDTTALAFAQVSSAVAYTFDQGLSHTAGSVKVELDTAAGAQTAGAGGGSSGLEFDVNTAAGKLRAAVHATGGLERTATGLAAKLNGNSLVSAAGGLSTAWAPRVQDNSFLSFEALTQYHAVAMSATVDRVQQARANDNARAKVIGLTMTAAGGAAVALEVIESGVAPGALVGATAGDIYYLQAAGGIGTGLPGGGNRLIQVGIAKNATDLIVQVIDYAKRAA